MACFFEFAERAAVGRRKNQEDFCRFSILESAGEVDERGQAKDVTTSLLAVLGDGLGGHVGGARASQTACTRFVESYKSAETTEFTDGLRRALEASNHAIQRVIEDEPNLDGMGCTLVAVHLRENALEWVSVGDSVLYHYRDGKIVQLNEDHSMVPVLAEEIAAGRMSMEDARVHPQRSVLRSALVGGNVAMVDLPNAGVPIEPGQWAIVASNGLLTLTPDEIAAVIAEHGSKGPDRVARGLIDAVEFQRRPNQDNTTVMAIRISSGSEAHEPRSIEPDIAIESIDMSLNEAPEPMAFRAEGATPTVAKRAPSAPVASVSILVGSVIGLAVAFTALSNGTEPDGEPRRQLRYETATEDLARSERPDPLGDLIRRTLPGIDDDIYLETGDATQ